MEATSHVKQTQDTNWAAYTEQLRLQNDSLLKRIETAEGGVVKRIAEVESHSQRRFDEAQREYMT